MHALRNLCQSWETFHQERVVESPYQASIGGIRLRLVELQAENCRAREIRAEKLGGNWKDFNGILHHQGLPYVPEIIKTDLISRRYDDLLVGHFGIKKMQELVAKKYYWKIAIECRRTPVWSLAGLLRRICWPRRSYGSSRRHS